MANAPFDPFGDRHDSDDDLGELAQVILQELKNTSDLVGDVMRIGKDELLRSVEQGIRTARSAAREAQKTVQQTSSQYRYRFTEEFKSAEADFAAQRQQRKESAAKQQNKQKSKLRLVSKNANTLLIPAALFGVPALVLLILSLFNSHLFLASAIPMFCLSAVSLGFRFSLKQKEKRYTKFLRTVGKQPSVNLRFLAAQMKRSYDKTVEDLRDMVDRGYFGENARIDVAAGELIIDQAAADALKAELDAELEKQRQAANAPVSGSYESMLTELQQLNVLIEDEAMSEKITRIETVARATFLAVQQKPEKSSSLRRFMDYYLPTTIKLLRSYEGFERSSVESENIRKSMENIESMMDTLCEAYEKQYDSLFLSETMDINAEIQTMDTLLRQDGYVGGANFGSAAATQEKKS